VIYLVYRKELNMSYKNQIKNECDNIHSLLEETYKSEMIEQRLAVILNLIEQEESEKFYIPDASDIMDRVHKEEITFYDTFNKLEEIISDLKRVANKLEELKDDFVSENNLCPKCGWELQSVPYYQNVEYQGSNEKVEFTDWVCDCCGTQGKDF